MNFKRLVKILAPLALLCASVTADAQLALINCAPGVPCYNGGPANTGTGDPAPLFNSKTNANFLALQPVLTTTGSGPYVRQNNPTINSANLTTPSAMNAQNVVNVQASAINGKITVPQGGTGQATLAGILKGNNGLPVTSAIYSDITGLWSLGGTCSSVTFLRGDGQCASPAGAGTVTGFVFNAANGFTGVVTTPTSAPALTLSVSPSGPLAGVAGAIVAASTTGTGPLVQQTGPSIFNANLNTPSAAVGTNFSAIPLSAIINQPTGTFPCTNTGSAGALVDCTIGGGLSLVGTVLSATGGGGGVSPINAQYIYANPTNGVATPIGTSLGNNLSMANGSLSGVQLINAQTGATYTVVGGDAGKLITFAHGGAIAVSLPAASSFGFTSGFAFDVQNVGVGAATITPATSTINGASSLTVATNTGCTVTSDGTNYQVSACTAIASGALVAGIVPASQILVNIALSPYNAVGDGATDNHAAISAAVAAVNTLSATGINACLYAPAGNYYVNGAVTQFAPTVESCVIGDGQYLTFFTMGPSFAAANNYLFQVSEAWVTTTSPNNYNFANSFGGARFQGFTITGNTTHANQGGIAFLDRNDKTIVRDVTCEYITLSCITVGAVLNKTQAYMRESEFYNVKAWHSGSTTVPAIEIGSTTSGTSSDATNEVKFFGLNIFASAGAGLVVDTNYVSGVSPKGTDDIMFYGTRIEDDLSNSDYIRIGGTVNNGSVYNIQFHGLELVSLNGGSIGFHVAGTSVATGQGDNGVLVDGLIIVNGAGTGIQLDQGKNMVFDKVQMPASLANNVVAGAAVTCCIWVENVGTTNWTNSISTAADVLIHDATLEGALTAASQYTVLGRSAAGVGPMGPLTTLPCQIEPAYFGDMQTTIGTCATVVSQASGNFNVFGTLSFGSAAGGTFTAPIITGGTAVTVASGTGNCAATGTVNGGVQGGDFTCTTSHAAQASTVTLTLPATARAYICNNNRDVTNPTTITQTGALSTTSVTLTLTSVTTGDVIQFGCPTAY